MSFPLFSIIIPVFNDKKNITRCINSVLSQVFDSFECLVIDDGSTDATLSICDAYAEKDSKIKVFHKNNEGISKTRQFGLNNSNGSFLIFIDSDDWVESSFLYNVNQLIESQPTDLIFLDFFDENSSLKEIYFNQKPSSTEIEQVLKDVLEGKQFSCLWNVVIKKSFINQNNIVFTDNINYGEDTLFITEILLNKPVFNYLSGAFYHHTYNSGSYTRKNKKNKYFERVKFLNELKALLVKYNRTDLNDSNFFPFNDKFEMLSSGVFTRKEYQSLYPLSFIKNYRKHAKYIKYFLLSMAESKLYFIARLLSILIRIIK